MPKCGFYLDSKGEPKCTETAVGTIKAIKNDKWCPRSPACEKHLRLHQHFLSEIVRYL